MCIFCLSSGVWAAQQDLLEPEKAFRFSARVLDASHVEVRYQIADGYYLYRERFAFAAETKGVKLGAAQIPEGQKKKDEFFGDVQTYRGELKIVLPVQTAVDGKVALSVTAQGCADVGVCYMPVQQTITFDLSDESSSWWGTTSMPDKTTPFVSEQNRIAASLKTGSVWFILTSSAPVQPTKRILN